MVNTGIFRAEVQNLQWSLQWCVLWIMGIQTKQYFRSPTAGSASFMAYYILGTEKDFHLLNPDQTLQNNTSTCKPDFWYKMFQINDGNPSSHSVESYNILGYWVMRHFPVLYVNCSTNLQDDLATNIFIRHFSYVSFLFSHMPVFQSGLLNSRL